MITTVQKLVIVASDDCRLQLLALVVHVLALRPGEISMTDSHVVNGFH